MPIHGLGARAGAAEAAAEFDELLRRLTGWSVGADEIVLDPADDTSHPEPEPVAVAAGVVSSAPAFGSASTVPGPESR